MKPLKIQLEIYSNKLAELLSEDSPDQYIFRVQQIKTVIDSLEYLITQEKKADSDGLIDSTKSASFAAFNIPAMQKRKGKP
jgi:hypothetical protein